MFGALCPLLGEIINYTPSQVRDFLEKYSHLFAKDEYDFVNNEPTIISRCGNLETRFALDFERALREIKIQIVSSITHIKYSTQDSASQNIKNIETSSIILLEAATPQQDNTNPRHQTRREKHSHILKRVEIYGKKLTSNWNRVRNNNGNTNQNQLDTINPNRY